MRAPLLFAATGLAVLFLALGWMLGRERAAPAPVAPAGPAVRVALAETGPIERLAALLPVLQGLRGDQLEPVVTAFEETFGAGGARETSTALLLEAWVRIDPDAALERVMSWPPDDAYAALTPLMRAWARRDPSAALEAMEGLGDRRFRAAAQLGLVRGWAESGDRGVWAFVAGMEPGLEREQASKLMMQAIAAREGAAELLEQVEDLPDDAPVRFKRAAFRTAASIVVRIDPELATRFVARHADGEHGRNLIARTGAAWAVADGPAALAWVQSLPEGPERDGGLRETLRRWIIRDREKALAWIAARRDDPSLASLRQTYVLSAGRDDPAAAMAWAAEVPDPEQARQLQLALGKFWLKRDPEAARPWLESHGLHDEIAAEIERESAGRKAAATRRTKGSEATAPASDAPPS